jgi:hypothetical protein
MSFNANINTQLFQNTLDGTQSGSVSLGNVSMGVNVTPFTPILVCVQLIGVTQLTSACTMSLGIVSPNFTDIMPSTALTALTGVGNSLNIMINSPTAIPMNSQIFANITVPAIASTFQIKVTIIGI